MVKNMKKVLLFYLVLLLCSSFVYGAGFADDYGTDLTQDLSAVTINGEVVNASSDDEVYLTGWTFDTHVVQEHNAGKVHHGTWNGPVIAECETLTASLCVLNVSVLLDETKHFLMMYGAGSWKVAYAPSDDPYMEYGNTSLLYHVSGFQTVTPDQRRRSIDIFHIETPEVFVVAIPDINLSNSSGGFINGEVSELDFWELSVNATLDDVSDGGFECNWSAGQLAKVIFDLDDNNFTVDQTINYSVQFNVSSSGTIQDILAFDICRVAGVSRDIVYSLNNESEYRMIPNSVIPLCTLGTHSEVNISVLPFLDQLNVSVFCPDCNPSNEYRIVPQIGGLFRWFRVVLPHFSELIFNSTSNRYQDDFTGESFHRHAFASGNNEVNVSCNSTTVSKTFDVAPAIPEVEILQINQLEFINGTSIEAGNVSVLSDCSGALIGLLNTSVFFSNGSLVKNVLDEVINIENSLLSIDDNYTVLFECTNQLGNKSQTNKVFEIKDTVSPTVNIIEPSGDIDINNLAQIQVLYSDLNLFGYNISVDCNILGNVFSEFRVNLSGTSYFLQNFTSNLTVNDDCQLFTEGCDDHTLIDWKPENIKTDYYKKNVTINNRVVVSDYSSFDVKDITFTQTKDSIQFTYEYDNLGDFGEKTYHYRIPLDYSLRDESVGHFASWDSKLWVDFVTDDLVSRVDRIDFYSGYADVVVKSTASVITFRSVGGLNCIEDSFNFSVVTPFVPPFVPSFDNITTGQAIFLGVLAFLWVVLLISGFALNLPFLCIFGAGLGVVMGIAMLDFSSVGGVVSIAINSILMIGIWLGLK